MTWFRFAIIPFGVFLFQVLVRNSIKITLSTTKLQPVSILEQTAPRSLPDSEDRRDKNWWECACSSFKKTPGAKRNQKRTKPKRLWWCGVAPRWWMAVYQNWPYCVRGFSTHFELYFSTRVSRWSYDRRKLFRNSHQRQQLHCLSKVHWSWTNIFHDDQMIIINLILMSFNLSIENQYLWW